MRRKRHVPAIALFLACLTACSPSPNEPRIDSRRLAQATAILDDTLRTELILAPDEASRRGLGRLAGPGHEQRLPDVSQAGFERARLIRLDLLDQLGKRPVLPPDHPLARDLRVTTDAYVRLSTIQANGHGRMGLDHALPYAIDPYGGIWIDGPDLLSHVHRVSNLTEAEAYVQRLAALADAIGDIKRRLIADSATGTTLPLPVLNRLRERIAAMIEPESTTLSSLTTDLDNLMLGVREISPVQRRALLRDASLIVEKDLYPAYADLLQTLDQIGAQAPGQPGLWAQSSDIDLYGAYLAWQTGEQEMDLSSLHKASLDEIERRRAALDRVFAESWRVSRPTPDSEVERVTPGLSLQALTDLFDERPQDSPWPATAVVVTRQESATEMDVSLTGQQLSVRAVDKSRPDLLVISKGQLQSWPVWLSELFSTQEFHRAALRMTDATSLSADRTPLRALIRVHALDEGWISDQQAQTAAVPTETPDWQDIAWQHWLLTEAVLAAADTGLHAERWESETAVQFISEQALLPEQLARDAVVFLASKPGHFASRRFGARHIASLRNRAEAILADRFDPAAFEAAILKGGSRPLSMVDEDVEAWYESVLATTQ